MKKNLFVVAIAAVAFSTIAMPSFGADAEVEALKQELAAQRKLIDQLLAAQGNRAPASPTTASDVDQRLKAQQKGALEAPIAPAPTDAAPPLFRFYGVADVAIVNQNSGYGNKLRFDGAGAKSPSRLGVQITKNVGGVKFTALAEAGVMFDTGSTGAATPTPGINDTVVSSGGAPGTGNQVFSRQIFAGLDAGFGEVTIGRQYPGSYTVMGTVGSAFGDGLYGLVNTFATNVGSLTTRANNSIKWQTPTVGNVRGILTYSTGLENNVSATTAVGSTSTNDKASRGFDLAAIYAAHGLQAAVTVWDYYQPSWVTAGETGLAKKKAIQLAANYDFGVAKVAFDFVHGTINGGNYENVTKVLSKGNSYSTSVKVPVPNHNFLLATFTHVDDKSLLNRDGTLFSLAAWHEFTPDISIYAAAGEMANNPNASYGLLDASNLVGNVAKPGFNVKGFETGMNYRF